MTEAGDEPARPTAPAGPRRRLWEINQRIHCSLIGTCLTLGDLRRIERRLCIEPLSALSDFKIHGNFVVWAGQSGPVAKQMHKLLDRRYAVTIRRFAAAATAEEVARLWSTSLQDGDIPGPYWAVLTHPKTGDALAMQVFGEVHMLSHLVGAANRADIRRLMKLETERDALADKLSAAKRRLAEQERDARRLVDQQAAEVRALTNRLATTAALEQRVRQLEADVQAFATGDVQTALQAELTRVQDTLAAAERELAAARSGNAALREENQRLQHENERSEAACGAVAAECEAIERLLGEQLAVLRGASSEGHSVQSAALDLCGRRIVYVGGRGGIIPHLRAVVERFGGIFLHHDGGVEEQGCRLDGLLGQGDAVFCPIDCISHDACLRAKRACRQRSTTFVPLRTCSLSSFVAGLRHIADAASAEPATDAARQAPNA
jgi:Membrane-bound metallopeptidase